MIGLVADALRRDPYAAYALMRRAAPVFVPCSSSGLSPDSE